MTRARIALAPLVALLTTGPAGAQSQPIAGTYEIAVCKREPCRLDDPANVQVKGHVVFAEKRVSLDDFPPEVRNLGSLRFAFERDGANGCYALEVLSLAPMTNAGIGGGGPLLWTPALTQGNRVTFGLYRSPDSGNRVTATITDGALRGVGTTSGIGAGAPPPHWGDDIVIGKRVGPPDLKPCADAMLRYLNRIRSGFQRSAMSALPQIGETDTGTTRPATSRFVLFLAAPLLEPPTQFERAGTPYRPGIWGIGHMYGAPDMVTIGVSQRMPDAAAYAAETVARIHTLLEKGVPPTRVTVVGAGRSTAIAMDVIRQFTEAIGVVFVGPCDLAAERPTDFDPTRYAVLDIAERDTPEAQRCSTVLGGAKTASRITIPARPKAAYAGAITGWLPLHMLAARPEDWVDEMARWIRKR